MIAFVLLMLCCGTFARDIFQDITFNTTCSYEEGDDIYPCQTFEKIDCREIEVSHDYKIASLSGQVITNAVVYIAYMKGYIQVEKYRNSCWSFLVSAQNKHPQVPFKLVFVDVPTSVYGSSFVRVYEDKEYRCVPFEVESYLKVKESYVRGKRIRMHYVPPDGISAVNVTLQSGECEITCNGTENACNMTEMQTTLNSFEEPLIFENMTNGYYCAEVSYGSCKVFSDTTEIVDPSENQICDSFYEESTYSIQYHKNEKRKLYFSFKPPVPVVEVSLVLLNGECPVTCDGDLNDCVVNLTDFTMNNFTMPHVFKDLSNGYYCLRITYGDCSPIHTETKRINEEEDVAKSEESSYTSIIVIILITIVVVVSTTTIITLICFKFFRMRVPQRQLVATEDPEVLMQWSYVHRKWKEGTPSKKVFLLYSRDCPLFLKVIEAFHQLLKNFTNLEVLNPLEENLLEQISENITGWLNRTIQDPNINVVFVVSEGALQRQKALSNNLIVETKTPHYMDNMFTQAVHHFSVYPKLAAYHRVFPIKFEDFTPNEENIMTEIVPLKCYYMTRHLGELLLDLRSFKASMAPGLDEIRNICPDEMNRLETAIRNMTTFCNENPDYFAQEFSFRKN